MSATSHPPFNGLPQHQVITYEEFITQYWTAAGPPSMAQEAIITHALQVRNGYLFTTHGRGAGKTTVAKALARMFNDL